jgi:hypothetical protein
MQYMKYYQRHRKTTFKPLVPTNPDQDDPFPPVKKRASFRKRRVTPITTPAGSRTDDPIVSAGSSIRQCIGESRPIQPESKERKTLNDERTDSLISLTSRLTSKGSADPRDDSREYNTQSPIDPNLFGPRLVSNSALGDDSWDDQSQA